MSFDPITMLIAGTAVGAVGSIVKGESEAVAYEYNASVARRNAQTSAEQGVAAVEAQQRNSVRRIGAAIAAYGASGVQVDSGSPMDVLADSARMAELDRLTTQYNYALKGAGYQSQAQLADMGAETARTSGYLNALSVGGQGAARAIPMFGSANPDAWAAGGGGAAP